MCHRRALRLGLGSVVCQYRCVFGLWHRNTYGIFASTNAAILAASASVLVCATSSSQSYAILAMLSLHALSTHAALINSMAACSRRCDFLGYMSNSWSSESSHATHLCPIEFLSRTGTRPSRNPGVRNSLATVLGTRGNTEAAAEKATINSSLWPLDTVLVT